jgi:hypothetical protein
MPKIYDDVGINYNKGTKRVNSVAPGCTIEYEADIYEERNKRVRKASSYRSQETNAALLAFKRSREQLGIQRPRDIEASPGFTVKITSMAEKDLSGWNTGKEKPTGDIPNGFTIAPAYNKGAYQVVPSTDIDAYTHRK